MVTDESQVSTGSIHTAFRDTLGKIGADNARRVINVLLESPFFYRDDDVDLFGLLRRRQSLFREFFEVFFEWDLYVDHQVARLIKPRTINPRLRPSQRHVFHVSGRHEYVLFVLLLEFYQLQADEQNIDLEREPEVRFVLADFVAFAFKRYREELRDQMPEEATILLEMRSLFRKLQHHRFIALTETTGVVAEEGLAAGFTTEGASAILYAMLPGLRCYRPEELNSLELVGRIDATDDGNGQARGRDPGEESQECTEDVDDVEGIEESES
jgi:hypothetical protein